jgi:hypothetical protein
MSVFNGKSPHLPTTLVMAGEDIWSKSLARAGGLAQLIGHDQEEV